MELGTEADWKDLERFARRIRQMPADTTAKIGCFNREEADWFRERLLELGVPRERFFMTWLTWPHSAPRYAPDPCKPLGSA